MVVVVVQLSVRVCRLVSLEVESCPLQQVGDSRTPIWVWRRGMVASRRAGGRRLLLRIVREPEWYSAWWAWLDCLRVSCGIRSSRASCGVVSRELRRTLP